MEARGLPKSCFSNSGELRQYAVLAEKIAGSEKRFRRYDAGKLIGNQDATVNTTGLNKMKLLG